MKAICSWCTLVKLGKRYSTNTTLHLTIRHASESSLGEYEELQGKQSEFWPSIVTI